MGEIEIRSQDVQQGAGPARMLTVEDVARRLAEIHAAQDDAEVAHGMEDVLRADVLAAIAAGAPDAPILAAAALRSDQLDFPRWYA